MSRPKLWLTILFGAILFCTITCETEIVQCNPPDDLPFSACKIYSADYTESSEFEYTNEDEVPIYKIEISESRVSHIPHGIFTELPYLSWLDISDCGIVEIRRSDFMYADRLFYLNLSHNNLTVLKDSIFSGAIIVYYIDLSHNKITTVSSTAFRNLNRLNRIELSYNRIKKIASNVFTKLIALRYLLLDSNLIELITAEDSYTNMNLTEFDLAGNSIVAIDPQAFTKTKFIQKLYLEDNKLKKLNFSDQAINIDELWIGNNTLTELQTNNKIRLIEASNNQLTGKNLFIGPGVVSLSLANNSLDNINFANPLSRLELDILLDVNQQPNTETKLKKFNSIIDSLNLKNFDMLLLDDLAYLNVEGNNLTQLPIDDFVHILPNLVKINIHNNNWTCSDLREILKHCAESEIVMNFSHFTVNTRPNIHGIQCNDDQDTTQTLISDNNTDTNNNYMLEINQNRIQLGTLQMENEQLKSDLNRVRIILDNISHTTSLMGATVNANVLEICTGQITNLIEARQTQLNSMSAQINIQRDQIQQISARMHDQSYMNNIMTDLIFIKNLFVPFFASYGIWCFLYKVWIV